LTCKNRLPYNLYCVGGDVKHCSLTSSSHIGLSIKKTRYKQTVGLFILCFRIQCAVSCPSPTIANGLFVRWCFSQLGPAARGRLWLLVRQTRVDTLTKHHSHAANLSQISKIKQCKCMYTSFIHEAVSRCKTFIMSSQTGTGQPGVVRRVSVVSAILNDCPLTVTEWIHPWKLVLSKKLDRQLSSVQLNKHAYRLVLRSSCQHSVTVSCFEDHHSVTVQWHCREGAWQRQSVLSKDYSL